MTNPMRFALMTNVRNRTLKLLQSKGWKGWTVTFDRSLERAGQCRFSRKEICYSIPFIEVFDEELLENTILHEVAHAFAGPGAGHGPHWAAICKSIGGDAAAQIAIPEVLATHENFPWLGTCPACGHRTGLTEAPEDIWLCGACPKEGDKRKRIFTWVKDGQKVLPLDIGGKFSEEYSRAFGVAA